MPTAIKLLLAIIIAIAVSSAFNLLQASPWLNLSLLLAFCAATLLATLVGQIPARRASDPKPVRAAKPSKPASHTTKPDGEQEQGVVKWFNVSKGFGFITRDNGDDLFVHQRNLVDSNQRGLKQGQQVSFTIIGSERGPQAGAVDTLDEGPADSQPRRGKLRGPGNRNRGPRRQNPEAGNS